MVMAVVVFDCNGKNQKSHFQLNKVLAYKKTFLYRPGRKIYQICYTVQLPMLNWYTVIIRRSTLDQWVIF